MAGAAHRKIGKTMKQWESRTIECKELGVSEEVAMTIGFKGVDSAGTTETFLISRALDPQDNKTGRDGVCLERGDQEYIAFGAIERCALTADAVTITIDYEAAADLDNVREWRFQFADLRVDIAEIRRALIFIFNGCDCLVFK